MSCIFGKQQARYACRRTCHRQYNYIYKIVISSANRDSSAACRPTGTPKERVCDPKAYRHGRQILSTVKCSERLCHRTVLAALRGTYGFASARAAIFISSLRSRLQRSRICSTLFWNRTSRAFCHSQNALKKRGKEQLLPSCHRQTRSYRRVTSSRLQQWLRAGARSSRG